MPRFLPCLLTAGCLATASLASAQSEEPDPLLYWVDACNASDPDLQALLEHNALIISAGAVHLNEDGSYRLNTQPLTQLNFPHPPGPPTVLDYCPQGRFYGLPQVIGEEPLATDIERRSAVQVGRDLVLTTWHNAFNPIFLPNYKVVFGLYSRDVGGNCVFPDFDNIPASQVYSLAAVAADGWAADPDLDLLLLQLDRVVSDDYPRVRRTGKGWPNDSVTVIGHPQRLTAKVDRAGRAGQTSILNGREWLAVEKVHLLADSSGSMVYNRTQRILETSAATGLGLTVEPVPAQACHVVQHQGGFTGRNASLRHFAQHIPAFELLVDDLDPVVHVATVGGTVTTPWERQVSAPSTATGPIQYEVVPPATPGPNQPSLTISPEVAPVGTLAPGTGFGIQEDVGIWGVSSCGVYERSYDIHDRTHGFVDRVRHVFEVGVREFNVNPGGRAKIEDLAMPLDGNAVYTLSNPRPDPVTVRVSANQPWVTLTAGAEGGPSIDVTLSPYDPGKAVLVGVNFATEPEPYPHSYAATLSFDFAPGTPCPGTGTAARDLTFSYGIETFSVLADVLIPDSTPSAAVVPVTVPESFCVKDVNAIVKTSVVPASHIRVRLVPPPIFDFVRLLWDRNADLSGPLDVTFDDDLVGPNVIHPVESLDVFDGQPGGGTWTFVVDDLVPGIAGTLDKVGLRFEACPTP